MAAWDVLQAHLDAVGAATMAGDWAAYRAHAHLPFFLDTDAAEMAVTTEADLRLGFDQLHATLRGLGVTDYIRVVREAREAGPGLIEGTFETNLVAQSGQRLVPPYLSTLTLGLRGGRWVGIRSRARLLNPRWPIGLPLPAARAAGG